MLTVQKYGGTSVADLDRIRNVAERVAERRKQGEKLVVIVSAMAGQTDHLLSMAYGITDKPQGRELDVLLATGEQTTCSLLAIQLNHMGIPATSFLGHQIRMETDSSFRKARIKQIDASAVEEALEKGQVAVVAGFQGVDSNGNITTLGRGGSDTSAVAVAAAMNADVCEIYTDVEGVYTADPRICPKARKLDRVSYEEMLELASLGAKVLQIRSVALAYRFGVKLCVRSSFNNNPGTFIVHEDKSMESILVAAVAHDKNEAKVSVRRVPDKPGVAANIFQALSDANIVVDMIIQNLSAEGYTDLTFTVPIADYNSAMELIQRVSADVGAGAVEGETGVAKVSIVGIGMRSHAGVATKMFNALAAANINIDMISTSEIKVSCVISEADVDRAVQVLHDAFELHMPSGAWQAPS
ncbi:MAG: aspartate kinase [Myxococcales bacterium]|nr:aspartate kinase [Myxococcales bacterium]